ncbi:MAG: XRE family transcriptional regulator [Verrucomicrobia bacterium]|nr:XRE family transcriptional regulator [Verrucomicrobiota bacterium]MBS0637214.1 XRE family transcriptional regulator [Verrucomicrobiota bacterium]
MIHYSEEDEKTEMALELERKIRKRGLTHQQAAEFLCLSDDELSTILRLKLAGFSAERLLNFCDAIGKNRPILRSNLS